MADKEADIPQAEKYSNGCTRESQKKANDKWRRENEIEYKKYFILRNLRLGITKTPSDASIKKYNLRFVEGQGWQ